MILTLNCFGMVFGPGPIETLDPVYTRPPIVEDELTQEQIDTAVENAHKGSHGEED